MTKIIVTGNIQLDSDTEIRNLTLEKGDSVLIDRGLPHQLISLEDNSIVFEVSTEHFDEDSYRVYRETPEDLLWAM